MPPGPTSSQVEKLLPAGRRTKLTNASRTQLHTADHTDKDNVHIEHSHNHR